MIIGNCETLFSKVPVVQNRQSTQGTLSLHCRSQRCIRRQNTASKHRRLPSTLLTICLFRTTTILESYVSQLPNNDNAERSAGFKVENTRNDNAEKYRHEFKYLCTDAQLAMLEVRLRGLMKKDVHAGQNGRYLIKSLYFDDINDRCFNENEDGTGPREKYRIRIYNNNPDRISLECKRKENDKINKKSCLLSKEQYDWLVYGRAAGPVNTLPELAKKLFVLKMCDKMEPKVIVSYERIPYVYRNGNVRVTFDRNIASSSRIDDFFRENALVRQILPCGRQLLEVKYDEYLPDHIYHALSLANMPRIAFSKYYLCRKYHT